MDGNATRNDTMYALRGKIVSIPKVDTTLTKEGCAADAKVTGDEIRNYRNYVTPEVFGAVGDGVTDDSKAIQECVNYAAENNLKVALLNKIYAISESIRINGVNIHIYGCGCGNSEVKTLSNTTAFLISSDSLSEQITLSDFSINGNNQGLNGVEIGVSNYCARAKLNNLKIHGFNTSGVKLNDCYYTDISNCIITYNNYGIYGAENGVITTVLVDEQTVINSNKYGVYVVCKNTDTLTFRDCCFEGNTENAIYIDCKCIVYIESCYTEQNKNMFYIHGSSEAYSKALLHVSNLEIHTHNGYEFNMKYVDGYFSNVHVLSPNSMIVDNTVKLFLSNLDGVSANDFINNFAGNCPYYILDINKISGKLSIKSNNDIEVETHIISKGNKPTLEFTGNAGASPSGYIGDHSTDNKGTVNFSIGSGATGGTLAYVRFNKPYSYSPSVILIPNNEHAPKLFHNGGVYVDVTDGNGFRICAENPNHAVGYGLSFNYIVLG